MVSLLQTNYKNKELPMNFFNNTSRFAVIAAMTLIATTSLAGLPEGAFKANSTQIASPDIMSFLIKKDPNSQDYYAVLAEYKVSRLASLIQSSRITNWIDRLYAYKIKQVSDLSYELLPLEVTTSGEIQADLSAVASTLTLAKDGSLKGAVISRDRSEVSAPSEIMRFDGTSSGSTWENFIPSKYLGTTLSNGLDYFNDFSYNLVINRDMTAEFYQENIKGEFDIRENIQGLFFTVTPKSSQVKGLNKVAGRIAYFTDIVNQKPKKTNDEILFINPKNARDIGFYYERERCTETKVQCRTPNEVQNEKSPITGQ